MATFQHIATVTAGTSTTTISFSSLPTTYTDLQFVITAQGATSIGNGGTLLQTKLNNDATFAYTEVYDYYNTSSGSGVSASSDTSGSYGIRIASSDFNSATEKGFANTLIYIPNYTSSNSLKTIVGYAGGVGGSGGITAFGAVFKGSFSAAVTSVDFTIYGGTITFAQNSRFSLYGITKA